MDVRLSCSEAGFRGHIFCTYLSRVSSALTFPAPRQTDMPQAYRSFCAISAAEPRTPKTSRSRCATMRLSASDQDVVDGDVDWRRKKRSARRTQKQIPCPTSSMTALLSLLLLSFARRPFLNVPAQRMKDKTAERTWTYSA
jgi:hypothetical protein